MPAKSKAPLSRLTPEQCRAARAWLGLSQDALASTANVSVASIRNFESGQRVLHPNTVASIRRAIEMAGLRLLFDQHGEPAGIAAADMQGELTRSRSRSRR